MASPSSFGPAGNCVGVSASGTTATAALPANGPTDVPCTIRVYNPSATSIAFVRWGTGSQTALTTDTMVGSGVTEVFSAPPNVTYVGVILNTGTGTVYFQRGDGI